MNSFPIANTAYEKFRKIENDIVQDLLMPVAGVCICIGGVVDMLCFPVRYTIQRREERALNRIHPVKQVINPMQNRSRQSVRLVMPASR
jgi:hypothetical protein